MINFEWSNEYSVKNPVLDQHHKNLFKFFNDTYDAIMTSMPFDVTNRILSELTAYSIFHFHEEEKLMLRANYEGYNQHKLEHSEFIEKIKAFKSNISDDNKELNEEIFLFLYSWLINHIEISDMKYADVLEKK